MSLKACKEVINERTARAMGDVSACGRQFERLTVDPRFAKLPEKVRAAIYRRAIDLDMGALEQARATSSGYEKLNDLVAAVIDGRTRALGGELEDLAEQLGIEVE